jgi:hypothetical protein
VDFLSRRASGEAELIQVSADLDDPGTRDRETRALLAAAAEYPGASLHLVTLTPESAYGMPKPVTVHPAALWFLPEQSDREAGGPL